MNYALDQFTMTDGEVLIVQGANSLYTYQNTGNSLALIQGSNDTVHWADIAQIAVGNSLVKEHSYKYLRLLGNTTVAVNRGEGDNTIGSVGSVNGQTGVVVLDADDVGATTQAYVDTQDSLLQAQIDLKANGMTVNQSLALKADLINGLIPASQLPSYVDDVLSFPDLISFPSVGEDGKIYIAVDVNKTYRWGGSSYVEIGGGGVALGETSSTAYRGDRGKVAYDHSLSQGNPHNTTTSEIIEGTKLFFTESRVNQTVLTGLNTTIATPALATDQLLVAIGKLQAQITNSGSSAPVWVELSTVGTVASYVTPYSIQVSRFQGMLWIRGIFNVNTTVNVNSELFRITAQAYKPYSYSTAGSARLLQVISAWSMVGASAKQLGFSALGNITNSSQASTTDVLFEIKSSGLSTADGTVNITPTIIGTLVN